MKKFMTWLFIIAKKQFKNPFLSVILVLMPFCAFLINKIPISDSDSILTAGIYVNESESKADELTLDLCDLLISQDSAVKFTTYSSEKELIRDIRNKNVDCGYVLSPDLSQRTAKNNSYKDSILILRPAGFTLQTSINEIIYANLIRLQGKNIITDYVDSTGLFRDVDITDELLANYDNYINGSQTFHINFISYDTGIETDIDSQATTIQFPVRGIMAILISIVTLFGGILWLKDREAGIFDVMSTASAFLCFILYTTIPTILCGLSGLLTLRISGFFTKIPLELSAMFIYVLLLELYAALITFIIRKSRLMTACVPVIILGSMIFCPVIINVSSYVPALTFVEKLFAPYYYLHFFG